MGNKRSIKSDIGNFDWLTPHLDHLRLEQITKEKIEEIAKIKEKSGVSSATVNRVLALIRSVLNRAYKEWECLEKVPLIKLRKENNARIRWLTVTEAANLLLALPRHLKMMAIFTLATGLRARNVRLLKWKNVDMSNRHLVIHADQNKSKRALGIPLNDDAMSVLRAQLGIHDKYVFVYHNKPVTQCSTAAWRKALKRAGIKDFRWHDLRHTWASWHVQNGTGLQELFELAGWGSFNMVLRYAHLSSDHLKKAAERISGVKSVESIIQEA
jgi:integrase